MSYMIINPNSPKAMKRSRLRERFSIYSAGDASGLFVGILFLSLIPLFAAIGINKIVVYKALGVIEFIVLSAICIVSAICLFPFKENAIDMKNGVARYDAENIIKDLDALDKECRTLKSVSESAILNSNIDTIINIIPYFKWEVASFWKKASTFHETGSIGTKDIIHKKYRDFIKQVSEIKETVTAITDTIFKYTIWSNPEDHLYIIKHDLDIMIQSLEEAHMVGIAS